MSASRIKPAPVAGQRTPQPAKRKAAGPSSNVPALDLKKATFPTYRIEAVASLLAYRNNPRTHTPAARAA